MTESPSPSSGRAAPWGRLAVTLGLLLVVGLMPPLGLPGLDSSNLDYSQAQTRNFDVFTLGVAPFLSAAALVELFALVTRRGRALRHGGPAGRAQLWRRTRVLAAFLCVTQALGITTLAQSVTVLGTSGSYFVPIAILTMTAGTFLLGLAAQLGGVYGLAGGFALLSSGTPIVAAIRQLATTERGLPRAPLDAAVLALLAAAVVVMTWVALRPTKAPEPAPPGEPTYREAPSEAPRLPFVAPAPASGIAPLAISASILVIPVTLAQLRLPLDGVSTALTHTTVYRVASLILLALSTAFLASAFHAPARVAAVGARAGAGSAAELEAQVRDAMPAAILRSLAFLVALFAVGQMSARFSGLPVAASALALATAVALDVAAEWRARRAADLVPVWPEHRSYAVPFAREALAAVGITVHARGEHLHRLLQFFGPFAPVELMVPRADEERAAELLREVLFIDPDAAEPGAEKPATAPPRRWTRTESSLLGVVALLAGGTLLLPGAAPPMRTRTTPARPAALQLLPVDDDTDAFDRVTEDLPPGASIALENTPIGVSEGATRTAARHYARMMQLDGESMDQARARLLSWAASRPVPAGSRVIAGPLSEYDEEQGLTQQIGFRTYVIKTDPILDGTHVRDARTLRDADDRPLAGWHVLVELSPEGAEQFRAFTAVNVKRRLAIVVDGVVSSAPVIQAEIPGGKVSIAMGTGNPDQQHRDAKALADRLLGR